MTRATRRGVTYALAAVVSFSLTACGGGREYAVPEQVCGITVNRTTLDPFLPDGEKLEIVGDSLVETGEDTRGHCEIRVDGKRAMYLRVSKVDKLYDPMDKVDAFRFTDREKMSGLPFPGEGALGDAAAMVNTECTAPGAAYLSVLVTVDGTVDDEVARRRRDLQAFAVDLVPAVKKALGCAA
ncbi:hypothetical protein [Streptomyces termitum]|uniref:hypothetical protein n=1 Tax=Streptomyces termitum TaxID=67368 RepID=UPI0037AE63D1